MLKRFFVNAILVISPFASYAQQLEGRIVDKALNPIPFSNISALTADSLFIEGVVTDSAGVFILPTSAVRYTLLRISSVGYKTKYIQCGEIGKFPIILDVDNVMLGEIVVKSRMPKYHRVQGGYSTDITNTILAKMNNADEVLSMLPRVTGSDGNFTIFGKGTPIIYVNGRKITNDTELRQIKTDNIKKITVLTNPGVQYDSEFSSVIIIKTRRPQGEGLSGNIDGTFIQSHKAGYIASTSLNWRSKKFDIFGDFGNDNKYNYSKQSIEHDINGTENHINEKLTGMNREQRTKNIHAKAGFNVIPNDSTSFGMEYHINKSLPNQYGHISYNDLLTINNMEQETINYVMETSLSNGPTHELDAYFKGKLGKVSLNFDGTYYMKKTNSRMHTIEEECKFTQNVNSNKDSRSHYIGTKLVAEDKVSDSFTISLGTEYSDSHINQKYFNKENIIHSTDNVIKESNIATFFSLDFELGNFGLSAGLRYEHILNSIYEDGVKNDKESRIYDRFFPCIDVSYDLDDFNIGLSYGVSSTKPTYSQLSNIVAYDSRCLYEGGNPALKMTMEHSLELSAMYKYFNASFAYEIDYNTIAQWGKLYDSMNDIVLLTNINIPKAQVLTCTISAQPVISHWHPRIELDFQKQYIDARGLNYDFNKPIYQFLFDNIFVVKPDLLLGINYQWHSSGADNYSFMGKYQECKLSITKTFFKRKLYAKLQINDIFRSTKTTNEMHTDYYDVKSTIYPNCRSLTFTLGLNFNKIHKRYAGNGAGLGEKSRL